MILLIAIVAMVASMLTVVMLICSRDKIKSIPLVFLSIAICLYMIGNYIEIVNFSMRGAMVGVSVRFLGIPFIPTLWYLCVREFCGIKFKHRWSVYALFVVPLVLCFLAQTWEYNNLLIKGAEYINGNNKGNLKLLHGPLYLYRNIYQYAVDLTGIVTLIVYYKNGTTRFKQQASMLLISVLIPIFNVETFIIHLNEYNIDITPYALCISMILFIYALFKYGVLNSAAIVKGNAMDYLREGVLLFDDKGIYMDSNRSLRQILPKVATIKLGTHINEMDYLPFNSTALNLELSKENSVGEFTREYDGIIKTFSISISRIKNKGKLIGYSVILNNISPVKKMIEELEVKSYIDALTNIFNRGYLFKMGESIVQNLEFSNEKLCIVMFDLDLFKNVNDTHGHIYGDYIIKTVALVSSSTLRTSDIIARYGGEEFCIILSGTSIQGAVKKADIIRQKISNYMFESEGIRSNITASFGVAEYNSATDEDCFIRVVKRADEALYNAKQTGRNKVCIYGEKLSF